MPLSRPVVLYSFPTREDMYVGKREKLSTSNTEDDSESNFTSTGILRWCASVLRTLAASENIRPPRFTQACSWSRNRNAGEKTVLPTTERVSVAKRYLFSRRFVDRWYHDGACVRRKRRENKSNEKPPRRRKIAKLKFCYLIYTIPYRKIFGLKRKKKNRRKILWTCEFKTWNHLFSHSRLLYPLMYTKFCGERSFSEKKKKKIKPKKYYKIRV